MSKSNDVLVRNRTNSTFVLGASILKPKKQKQGWQKIKISTKKHFKSLLNAERNKIVEIKGSLPKELFEKYGFELSAANTKEDKVEVSKTAVEIEPIKESETIENIQQEIEESNDLLTEDRINSMRTKAIVDYIEEYNLPIDKELDLRSLRNELLKHFGYAVEEKE